MNEQRYMNVETGSVGTFDEWWYEAEGGDLVNAVDLGEVVAVVRDSSGSWTEGLEAQR